MKTSRRTAFLLAAAVVALATADAHAVYHPATGRFLQRDPGAGGAMPAFAGEPLAATEFVPRDPTGSAQYADGMNLYQYASSRPVNFVNPMGTKKKLPVPSSPTTSSNYHALKDRTDCCERVTERTMTAYWTDDDDRRRFIDHLLGTGARFGVDNILMGALCF